ncbi:MAG TPA: 2Fe-2S iron-sulfur cluster-binding protein [Spirochaetia bacterium]|nr:2Fe-2S iron-sulfur cluster-binding protein [Spirochaetia bacterium]
MINAIIIINNRRYTVECSESNTVLDVLESIRKEKKLSLHYRHSCHHGSCGTCGAIINCIEGLMCLTKISDLMHERKTASGKDTVAPQYENGKLIINLEPLKKATYIADIAVYPAQLFESIPETASYKRSIERANASQLEPDSSYDELYKQICSDAAQTQEPVPDKHVFMKNSLIRNKLELCIECGLCLSACPEEFRGPAGLAAIHTALAKNKPETSTYSNLLALAYAEDGIAQCKRHFACSRVCPQGVAPGRRIQELRAIDSKNSNT